MPRSATSVQGQLALLHPWLLDNALAAIEAIADPVEKRTAQIRWNAITWRRDDPLIAQTAAAFGLTEAEVDDFYGDAATR